MAVKKVRYFTKERNDKVNPINRKRYDKYLKSNIIKNPLAKESTYKVYQNYFNQFLVYLSEEWDNIDIYSDEFMENAIDIMEGFMMFCQETLENHKKIINTKLSAVSSFFLWSQKRKLIQFHPFGNGMLERMKKANEEHIIGTYFLTEEQQADLDKLLEKIEECNVR